PQVRKFGVLEDIGHVNREVDDGDQLDVALARVLVQLPDLAGRECRGQADLRMFPVSEGILQVPSDGVDLEFHRTVQILLQRRHLTLVLLLAPVNYPELESGRVLDDPDTKTVSLPRLIDQKLQQSGDTVQQARAVVGGYRYLVALDRKFVAL